jgi:hypothetical protein
MEQARLVKFTRDDQGKIIGFHITVRDAGKGVDEAKATK